LTTDVGDPPEGSAEELLDEAIEVNGMTNARMAPTMADARVVAVNMSPQNTAFAVPEG
jgi:hypothetical protein